MGHSGDPTEILRLLETPNVVLARPESVVFGAMLKGWELQQRSRGLRERTIGSRLRLIQRFQEFTDKMPWEWGLQDAAAFVAGEDRAPLALSTMRDYHGTIRTFCAYLLDPAYDWGRVCERHFGQVPSQVCLPWNTVEHVSEYEGSAARRPFSYDELDRFFETAHRRVEEIANSGRKGALAALRDVQLFKTAYAFGLRLSELAGLDLADMHYNAQVPHWGRYAALHVRYGKASKGGAPKRRTVLLVPEFDWWIEGMKQWVEQARARFAPGDLTAIWVTERRTRVTPGYIDDRFAEVRDEAKLPAELTMHSLRHSYVTHLVEFGYADRFVQEQVGHAHSSTTSIYTSVSGDFKNRVLAKALERIVEEVPPDD